MIDLQSEHNNRFFALRHGQSQANVQGIICSNPSVATTKEYGLSETGQQQAILAGRDIIATILRDHTIKGICIVSSDFARALETAEAVRKGYNSHSTADAEDGNDHCNLPPLYQDQVIADVRLRERWFGDFDMTTDSNYQLVWAADAKDSSHTLNRVESVDSVLLRASSIVKEYDAMLCDHMIVLVAHGDVLQILQTAFVNMDGRLHRSLEHLETAKLRRMDNQPNIVYKGLRA